jgi:hypothetical protein
LDPVLFRASRKFCMTFAPDRKFLELRFRVPFYGFERVNVFAVKIIRISE